MKLGDKDQYRLELGKMECVESVGLLLLLLPVTQVQNMYGFIGLAG